MLRNAPPTLSPATFPDALDARTNFFALSSIERHDHELEAFRNTLIETTLVYALDYFVEPRCTQWGVLMTARSLLVF